MSILFDGANDYGQLSSVDLTTENAITVGYWWYALSYTPAFTVQWEIGDGTTEAIIYSSNAAQGFTVICKGNVGQNGQEFGTGARPGVDAWHHVCCEFDFSRAGVEIAYYLDGSSQTAIATPWTANNTGNFTGALMNWGGRASIPTTVPSHGHMDDFVIYRGAIAAEVAPQLALRRRARTVRADAAIRRWDMSHRESVDRLGGQPIVYSGAVLSDRTPMPQVARRRVVPIEAAAPSGFQPAWAARSTVTIQPGVAA